MPAGEYKLKLLIDDSKIRELETRLGRALGKDQKSGLDAVFGNAGSAGKNLAKLGVIAAGVGVAVTTLDKIWRIGVESSGHAQATFKLWDTAMRLIFRPIGDTIGLVLRPFGIAMIKWAVPFYIKFTKYFDELLEAGEKASEGDVPGAVKDIVTIFSDFFLGEEKTKKLISGGDKLEEGDVFGASSDIGGTFIETFFGEDFASNWESNQDALSAAGKAISDFLESFKLIPEAYGDTGEIDSAKESITGLKDELGLFESIVKGVQKEVKKRATLEGLGIEPGSDFTSVGQAGSHSERDGGIFGTSSNTISRDEFLNLRKQLGNKGALEYIKQAGFTVAERGSSPATTSGGRGRFGESSAVTINVNGAVDESTLRKIGKVASDEISKSFKRLPGRRG